MARFGCIIINYRYPEDTLACLNSLRASGASSFKIFLVNNFAADGSGIKLQDFLHHSGMEFEYLEPKNNLGFAGGCNLGIRAALSISEISHIILLNNDTKVSKDFTSEAAKAAAAAPGEIIAGTVLDSVTGKPSFNIGQFTLLTGQIRHLLGEGQRKHIDFVSGCLMVVPSEVFRKVGLFAEEYFMYWEDADFCLRLRKSGIKIRHWPSLRLSHALSSTTTKSATPKEYYRIRNQTYLITRRGRLVQKGFYLCYLGALICHRFLFRPRDLRQSFRGAIDGLMGALGPRHD